MEHLVIHAEPNLPDVNFNAESGNLSISGRSVPEFVKPFYDQVLDWIGKYSKNPAENTHFVFHLDFFNISSSKAFLFILYKLLEIQNSGKKVKVTWMYSDAYLLGAGRDYAYMVKLPFEFVKTSKMADLEA